MPALTPVILVIDDEPQIRRLLRLTLEAEGYRVLESETGQHGLLEAARMRPDAIVLDLGLPDLDGLQVLARIREWSRTPILILSVRDDERDKVSALDLGADDYVNKPFATGELLARLRAIQRRAKVADDADPVVTTGPLRINLATRQVLSGDAEVKLTATEYALLSLLAKYAGRVVTQRQLLREVWGPNAEEQSQYLRVHFTHLRRKVDPGDLNLIQTEPRIGYRLRMV